jgi:hypothetical protein
VIQSPPMHGLLPSLSDLIVIRSRWVHVPRIRMALSRVNRGRVIYEGHAATSQPKERATTDGEVERR